MTKKPYVTAAEVQAYFEAFKAAVKDLNEDWADLLVNSLTGIRLPDFKNLATVAVQMHILDIPADRVETDFEKMRVFISSIDAAKSDAIYQQFAKPEMTGPESAAALVNTLVFVWNEQRRKTA